MTTTTATTTKIRLEVNEDVNRIIDFISANYTNSLLNVKIAAVQLGMAEQEISFILSSCLNTTFRKCLMQIRLHKMRQMLKQTKLPVREVYKRVGLPDPLRNR